MFGDDFPGALVETGEFEGEKLVLHGELGGGAGKVQMRNVTWMASPGKLISETYMSRAGAPEKLLVRVEAKQAVDQNQNLTTEARRKVGYRRHRAESEKQNPTT